MFGRNLVTAHQASNSRGARAVHALLSNAVACTKVRLAVEVDGGSHEQRAHLDAARDRVLSELGWRILRIEESAVFADLDAVIATITRACCT
jgi:very-short-patch-repair endonuclease